PRALRCFPTRRSSDLLGKSHHQRAIMNRHLRAAGNRGGLKTGNHQLLALFPNPFVAHPIEMDPARGLVTNDREPAVLHGNGAVRSEEHTSELQSRENL